MVVSNLQPFVKWDRLPLPKWLTFQIHQVGQKVSRKFLFVSSPIDRFSKIFLVKCKFSTITAITINTYATAAKIAAKPRISRENAKPVVKFTASRLRGLVRWVTHHASDRSPNFHLGFLYHISTLPSCQVWLWSVKIQRNCIFLVKNSWTIELESQLALQPFYALLCVLLSNVAVLVGSRWWRRSSEYQWNVLFSFFECHWSWPPALRNTLL